MTLTKELWNYRAVVIAATLGWVLDAFDFCVLLFLIPTLIKVFHTSLPMMALVATGTLLAKTVGNIVWGAWADRVGRRIPFMVGVIWFAAFCGLSGLAWSYGALLVFRILFGLGFGGQWSAAAPLLMETVPERLKGISSGIMMAGWEVGYILAALAFKLVFPIWGWRAMFLLGLAPALLAWYIMKYVKESPVMNRRERPVARLRMSPQALQGWSFMGALNFIGYAVTTLYPTFLLTVLHYTPSQVFINVLIYSGASIIGKPLMGWLAEKIGQRPMTMTYSLLVIPAVLFSISHGPFDVMMGAALRGLFPNSLFGVVPAYLADRFPVDVRSLGMGIGYAVAGVTGGLAPYLVALWTKHLGLGHSIALFSGIGALIVLGITSFKVHRVKDEPMQRAVSEL